MTQLALILLQLWSRQLTCAFTQGKKMTTEMALYIILQQPIRAKLFWWLLNLSFKNREATLLLLFGRNDVIIRLFVHSGVYFHRFPFLLEYKKIIDFERNSKVYLRVQYKANFQIVKTKRKQSWGFVSAYIPILNHDISCSLLGLEGQIFG